MGFPVCHAQAPVALSDRIQKLDAAIVATQRQLEKSQRELEEMRKELSELRKEMTDGTESTVSEPTALSRSSSQGTPDDLAAAVQDIREQQAMEESQIATHEQAKVETVSKYPFKFTGMVLMNGFVNTVAVDQPATPAVAVPGSGTIGASVRQTIFGFDARGPRLFGANSFADLRMDFTGEPKYAASSSQSYPEYSTANSTSPRLRTVHAGLEWSRTQAYFALERPILSPDTPTSLTAIAEPALAWSGNLWAWVPQVVVTQQVTRLRSGDLQIQAALIDPADAPLSPSYSTQTAEPASTAEQSSRPGVEARIALVGSGRDEEGNHIGAGGYFARHVTPFARTFDSWAATLDARFRLPAGLQFSGNFYRGLGLGGLGAGAYKDFAYKANPNTGGYFFKALDDVGGWAQLKEKLNERLELNAAYGMDSLFASQMRRYIVPGGTMFQNLTVNRTYTGNVIYAPSAFLLFSLEYRHINSRPITGSAVEGNIFGIAAGYKF
jgi:hypothetical protein